MKKLWIGLIAAALMLAMVPETMAGHHGHRREKGNDGLRLAAGIVHLVREVIAPTPQVVCPAPAVIAPPHRIEYRRPAPPVRHHKKNDHHRKDNRKEHRNDRGGHKGHRR